MFNDVEMSNVDLVVYHCIPSQTVRVTVRLPWSESTSDLAVEHPKKLFRPKDLIIS